MNYQRLAIVIGSLIFAGFLLFRINSSVMRVLPQKPLILRPTLTPTATPTPTPPLPARFSIPKLEIDIAVEPVANDEMGTMQLPQEVDKVGWYTHGFKPGEMGNAVIGGHLDLTSGAPAIFYRLNELVIGDTITVTDELGMQRVFIVSSMQSYPYDIIPLESIFGRSDSAHLNLITCTGSFNQITHTYSHRLIIYSDIVK